MKQVLCTTCDPPSICYVPDEWETSDPYICTVCQKRMVRRLENEMYPRFGRMQHGEVIALEAQKGK